MAERTRVLVVDDSAYLRKVVSQMLRQSPVLEVVGTARDGAEALEKVNELQPDVITLDLNMPTMDGVAFIRRQMIRQPLPIVVVSIASEDGKAAAEAIELGVVEFVRKPTGLANERVLTIAKELVEKVEAAGRISRDRLRPMAARLAPADSRQADRVDAVVLGLSTGGPQALRFLLSALPGDLPVPLAAVVHLPLGYTGPFATKLDQSYAVQVREAREGLEMKPGRLILGQAGRPLRLQRVMGEVVCRLDGKSESSHRPSVDMLFRSAAEAYGKRLLAVVLTGMGEDGTMGAAWIKAAGGSILVEAESSCVVYGMPRSVLEAGLADAQMPLAELPEAILDRL